jgi:hypothetical protein
MNERIRELLVQAIKEVGPDDDDNGAKEKTLERFAELILQDIDRIVDDLYHAIPLEQAAVLLTLDENIKEHFYGVEE